MNDPTLDLSSRSTESPHLSWTFFKTGENFNPSTYPGMLHMHSYQLNHYFRTKIWSQEGTVVILLNTRPPPQPGDHMISSLWLGSRRRLIWQHAMTAQTKPSGHTTYVTSVFLSTTRGNIAYNEAHCFEWGVKWRVLWHRPVWPHTHTHTHIYMIMSAGTEPVAHTNNFLTACVNVSAVLKMMDTC